MSAPVSRTALPVLRAAYGAALLAAPRATLRHVPGADTGGGVPVFARVLGARQLAEAWLTRGGRATPATVGAAVDAIHAATAVGLAVVDGRHRPLALANAAVATLLAADGFASR